MSKGKGISSARAKAVARELLSRIGERYELQGESEHTFGWMFGVTARRGQPLVGNAPIIVDRWDGSARFTGTGKPSQVYIDAYQRFGSQIFDERRWEDAVDRQRMRVIRAATTARRDGLPEAPQVELVIDWDQVEHELEHGAPAEPMREPTRCFYCDVYITPRGATPTPRGLACPRCARTVQER